jgi:hypothetical protein
MCLSSVRCSCPPATCAYLDQCALLSVASSNFVVQRTWLLVVALNPDRGVTMCSAEVFFFFFGGADVRLCGYGEDDAIRVP